MKRSTYLERRWPDSPLFQKIAWDWCKDQSRLLLEFVWSALDRLRANELGHTPMTGTDQDKERQLNLLMGLHIRKCMSGNEPFCIFPEVPEYARRLGGRAMPPKPDLAFVLYEYPRSVWPIEAKVLKHEQDVRAYIKEIRDNFLTGRYATFSSEGAMLGYLFRGSPSVTFECIGEKSGFSLRHHPAFAHRNHKVSEHQRDYLPHLNSPRSFSCHHLLIQIVEGVPDAVAQL